MRKRNQRFWAGPLLPCSLVAELMSEWKWILLKGLRGGNYFHGLKLGICKMQEGSWDADRSLGTILGKACVYCSVKVAWQVARFFFFIYLPA